MTFFHFVLMDGSEVQEEGTWDYFRKILISGRMEDGRQIKSVTAYGKTIHFAE